MSTLGVVAEILREVAPRALKAREIAALAGPRLPTSSRTPETVVSRDLALDVKHRGAASRFLRVDRGAFVLKKALSTALYCDIDPYVNAWTRNLIAAGEIAPGVVDERSIRDLKPADVASYRQVHVCNGIGIWSRALRDAGWADEWPIFTGSLPCQPWSSAGKRGGETDDRHLWPEWFRLIRACGPGIIVGEQVASKDGYRWLDLVAGDFKRIGYHFTATELSAASVGAPHKRQRIYFVAFLGGYRLPESTRGSLEASALGSGLDALHTRVEDEKIAGRLPSHGDHFDVEITQGPNVVAYTSERGREVLGASRLHDRWQCGNDAARCSAAHGGSSVAVSHTAGARLCVPQDAGTDRGAAGEGSEAIQRRSSGDIESQRSGEVDGIRVDGDGTVGLGDAGIARGRRNAREVPRAQGVGEGERIEAGDLANESISPSADDGEGPSAEGGVAAVEMVRGAIDDSGNRSEAGPTFRPGDRIRIGGDPSWGGAVGGYWAQDVEWVYCRPEPGHKDGRWRPVEPCTQPLVDRSAPSMGRTRAARLRGFGNAICLPLAKSFVEAMIDAFADFVQTTIELPRGSAQTTVEQPCGEAGAQPVSSVARVRGEEDAA